MLPLSTHKVSVLREADSDLSAEPTFSTPELNVVASGIPAVLAPSSSSEAPGSGQQTISTYNLILDTFNGSLLHTDIIKDEATDLTYQISSEPFLFKAFGLDHYECTLLLKEGLI